MTGRENKRILKEEINKVDGLSLSGPENLNFDEINAIKKVAPNEQTRVAPVGRSR